MYRSKLEERIHKKLGRIWKYEGEKVKYIQIKEYTPDFVKKDIWIEVKGRFFPGDLTKYKIIKWTAKIMGKRFVFVFSNPYQKLRKGAKLTMAGWANKQGIEWFSEEDCKKIR